MNKRITAVAALALAACSSAALAQSNVAFYGVMDLGISQDRGGVRRPDGRGEARSRGGRTRVDARRTRPV